MTADLRSIVVIGASIAATSAVDTLRAEGFDGSIVMIGEEPHPAYTRPSLSKAMLQGVATSDSIALTPLGPDVEVLTNTRAESLHLDDRTVAIRQSGVQSQLRFDGVILATGARARSVLRPGQRGEYVVRCLDDCLALSSALQIAQRVAILGGGFLGMELASSIRSLGVQVTVVDVAPPLLRQLGPTLSDIMSRAARDHGVHIEVSPAGATLHGHPAVKGIRLADGRIISADLVISAVGDVPNVEWLAGSGLASNGPLPVGPGGWVAPGVVAAGDMTGVTDTATGELIRTPHWHAAIGQGRAAARTLLNGKQTNPAPETSYFWTEGFGLEVKITGTIPRHDEPVVLDGDLRSHRALLQWFDSDRPVAAASVNHRMPLVKLKRLASRQPAETSEVT